MHPTDSVWKSAALTAAYLEGVRGAIPLAAEQIEIMLRLIAACGRRVDRFLDLGCGDGVLSTAILGQHPGASGVLLDFSEPMLVEARKRFSSRTDLHFLNVDYGEPAWTSAVAELSPFDAIVSGYSIHHQPDTRKKELYAEIYGLLRPGGLFVNVEHVASASEWVASIHDQLFIDALHRLQPSKTREEIAQTYYYRPDKEANILAPVEVQCEWLREIGFRDVDCYLKIFELAVFGGRRSAKQRA